MEYVAFLLGINVGRRIVKMAQLKTLVESLGYTDVRTTLASGNVRFSAKKSAPEALATRLESALQKEFGFEVGVIVRTVGELEKMLKLEPFRHVKVTKNTRRYVTLLSEKPLKPLEARSVTPEYEVLKVTQDAVYSVLEINASVKTPDIMKLLGQSYGRKITTRNWNTIEKILKSADGK
ncbi:DUF1697 domain-containing protein [Candidatus Kaiserbacteria bacterium]|nr:DUF1697 domain-containing protein [Candidatus Kaiserbacteria bacterium]